MFGGIRPSFRRKLGKKAEILKSEKAENAEEEKDL